jgi:superfamily II DNA or RNA helicase
MARWKAQIKIGPVHSQILNKEARSAISPALLFSETIWIKGRHGRTRKVKSRSLLSKGGYFLSGFLDRIELFCNENEIELEYTNHQDILKHGSFSLPGIVLRSDQKRAIEASLELQRGVIRASTGSGKTILALSILKALKANLAKDKTCLIIVGSKDLFKQTLEELDRFDFKDVGVIGAGKVEPDKITVAIINSIARLGPTEFDRSVDVVIIDECDLISSLTGMYASVLKRIPSAVKLGFTATLPEEPQKVLVLEGFVGPVIATVTDQELEDKNVLAKTKVTLLIGPYDQDIKALRMYQDAYTAGIVENKSRNRKILKAARRRIRKGRSVLILVRIIKHGQNLMDIAAKEFPGLDPQFVQGATDDTIRNMVKKLLMDKESMLVIATSVFGRGLNIPSLDCVIHATAWKSKSMLEQNHGRGKRRTEEKIHMEYIDVLDWTHKNLSQQTMERLMFYHSKKWIQLNIEE